MASYLTVEFIGQLAQALFVSLSSWHVPTEIAELLGIYWDNGKSNGNYYRILGIYWDNGKENGNYYRILGVYRDNGKENGNYYWVKKFEWSDGESVEQAGCLHAVAGSLATRCRPRFISDALGRT